MLTFIAIIATIALMIVASRTASGPPRPPAKGEDPLKKRRKGASDAAKKNADTKKATDEEQAWAVTATARQYMQYARDQASQAEADEYRANSGDRNSRLSAADSAQYHANYAREAAENAASSASGGPLEANDAAMAAQQASNRAQAAADRAKYTAATAR